jgi:8-oxo-dGTP pyrophosphatase MutT (NUDIX family)
MNAIPVDAATLMLLRPCPDATVKDIEVLLVLRSPKSRFVPGYHVFPGGILDPEDYEPVIDRFVQGIGRKQPSRILADMPHAEKALGLWVAAIRETFEEVGILIARKQDGSPVRIWTREERSRFGNYRQVLVKGEIKFSRILEEEDIVLPIDTLHYFSHWITPEPLPLRYGVRFFVTEAPAGQAIVCDGVELTDHVWLRPSAALKDYEAGKIGMVLPQIMTLIEFCRFKTVAEAISFARKRHVHPTLTTIRHVDGQDVEAMPDGSVYEKRPPIYPWPDQ